MHAIARLNSCVTRLQAGGPGLAWDQIASMNQTYDPIQGSIRAYSSRSGRRRRRWCIQTEHNPHHLSSLAHRPTIISQSEMNAASIAVPTATEWHSTCPPQCSSAACQ